MKQYTDEEYDRLGEAVAQIFTLKHDPDHADRWRLGYGYLNKTNKGLVMVLLDVAEKIKKGTMV